MTVPLQGWARGTCQSQDTVHRLPLKFGCLIQIKLKQGLTIRSTAEAIGVVGAAAPQIGSIIMLCKRWPVLWSSRQLPHLST